MASRRFCDFCGKEILATKKEPTRVALLNNEGYVVQHYKWDICVDCSHKLLTSVRKERDLE